MRDVVRLLCTRKGLLRTGRLGNKCKLNRTAEEYLYMFLIRALDEGVVSFMLRLDIMQVKAAVSVRRELLWVPEPVRVHVIM